MKKLISLVLALVLCLTAVSVFAEVFSPNAEETFAISGDAAETDTAGITLQPVSAEAKEVVAEVVKEAYLPKTTFVDTKGETVENPLKDAEPTNVAIVPMPSIDVDENTVTAEIAEIITPIPTAIAEFLDENKDNIIIIFTYKVGDDFYSAVVEYELQKAADGTDEIVYKIPVEILKAAEGCPCFIDIELKK